MELSFRNTRLVLFLFLIISEKRQPTDQKKTFVNDVTNKGLISELYKQLIQLNVKTKNKKKTQPNPKMSIRTKHFSKADIEMAKRHMKRCTVSLIIREVQIKTTIPPHTGQNSHH